jgi:hypothetical protein
MSKEDHQLLLLTMFQLTLRLASTTEVPDNQLTMETTDSQLQMPGAMDLNSLIPIKVLVNGGKFK